MPTSQVMTQAPASAGGGSNLTPSQPAQPAAAATPGQSGAPPTYAGENQFLPSPGQLGQFAPEMQQYLSGPGNTQANDIYSQEQQQLLGSLTPFFQQQQQNLNGDLASRGIFNSGAASSLQNDLSGQQAATYAGQLTPMLQSLGQNQETNQLAGYQGLLGQEGANQNASNQYLQSLLGEQFGVGNAALGSYLGSFGNTQAEGILANAGQGAASGYQNAFNNQQSQNNYNQQQFMQGLGSLAAGFGI